MIRTLLTFSLGVAAGECECFSNRYGAVSVLDREGERLGLRLDEFEPIAWRVNESEGS